jgi:VWFA-related protein
MKPGAASAIALSIAACGGSGLKLTRIDSSHQRPSNVAVYFTVETDDGEPVAGLTADAFRIYEDGNLVSVHESKQTILNPEVAAAHHAILLVDMSGSVTESDDVPTIVAASTAFADRIGKYQRMAVYAFDGRPQLTKLADFTGDSGQLATGIARLDSFEPKDPSTNLNGAVLEATKILDRQMRRAREPLVFGTLIVFSDGSDRAARVSRQDLHAALDEFPHDIYVIGVGEEIDEDELTAIGRSGAILTKNRAEITSAFEQMAARVEAASRRYYLLGYCSPARHGAHEVTIEANANGRSGSLRYDFDARGFTAPCDPEKPPRFDTRRPRDPVPAEAQGDAAGSRWD